MSQSAAKNESNPPWASAPAQIDAATAELLMALRLNGSEASIASGDVARRYVSAELSATLSVNHIIR
jgi:hypothetical protein